MVTTAAGPFSNLKSQISDYRAGADPLPAAELPVGAAVLLGGVAGLALVPAVPCVVAPVAPICELPVGAPFVPTCPVPGCCCWLGGIVAPAGEALSPMLDAPPFGLGFAGVVGVAPGLTG